MSANFRSVFNSALLNRVAGTPKWNPNRCCMGSTLSLVVDIRTLSRCSLCTVQNLNPVFAKIWQIPPWRNYIMRRCDVRYIDKVWCTFTHYINLPIVYNRSVSRSSCLPTKGLTAIISAYTDCSTLLLMQFKYVTVPLVSVVILLTSYFYNVITLCSCCASVFIYLHNALCLHVIGLILCKMRRWLYNITLCQRKASYYYVCLLLNRVLMVISYMLKLWTRQT